VGAPKGGVSHSFGLVPWLPVDCSKVSAEGIFNTVQKVAEDENFMDFENHLDMARRLRDRVMAVDVRDSDLVGFLEKEPGNRNEHDIDQMMQDTHGWDILLSTVEEGNEAIVRLLLDGALIPTRRIRTAGHRCRGLLRTGTRSSCGICSTRVPTSR